MTKFGKSKLMMKQNLVIVGFRGSGKTKFGRDIAEQLKLPFADLDAEVEFVLGDTIDKFVEKYGWQKFREVEQRVAHDFTRNFSGIVATGGGTIENSKNLQNLKKTGRFVFFNPNFAQVKKRLMADKTSPRLNPDIPLSQEIDQMWMQRKDIYSATADIELSPDLEGDVATEAKKMIESLPDKFIPNQPIKKRVAIFSSSGGTTFQGLLDAQKRGRIPNVEFTMFVTDKPDSGALKIAKKIK